MTVLKMKKKILAVVLTVFLALSVVPLVTASDFSGDVYVDFTSKYLWRGMELLDTYTIQPGFDLNFGALSFGFWGSYHPVYGELQEADYTVSFADTVPGLDMVELSAGFTVYTFPMWEEDEILSTSTEIFAGVAVDVVSAPYLTVYYDVADGAGGYVEGGLSHDFDLEVVTLSIGGAIGYNIHQWGYEESFSVASGSVSVGYVLDKLSVSLGFTGQLALDDQYINDYFTSAGIAYEF